jgi:hypothetical protein
MCNAVERVVLSGAEGAILSQAWGSAPGFVKQKTASAESAIHLRTGSISVGRPYGMKRAFSACFGHDPNSGALPHVENDAAPLALDRNSTPEPHGANQSLPLKPAQSKNAEQSACYRRRFGNNRAPYSDIIDYVLDV